MITEMAYALPLLPIAYGIRALRRPYGGVDQAKIRQLETELGFREPVETLSFAPGALWHVADPRDVQVVHLDQYQQLALRQQRREGVDCYGMPRTETPEETYARLIRNARA